MPTIKPKGGVNFRLHPHDVSRNQWVLMQNVDMTHDEHFTQIKGSTKFHGTSLGVVAPSAIMPCYNNELDTCDILAAVDDKIYKKNLGTNEFEELFSGLPANKIMFSLNEGNKQYIPHPDSGLYEYDGISKVEKISDDKFIDIIMSKETNRAFATRADIRNAYNWTDDLVTMGGVPILWDPLNTDTVPTTDGDSIEKIMFMRGRLVFFMTHSVWIEYVNGGPENWRYERIPTTVGCIAPKTVKMVKDEIWFLGSSPEEGIGIYAFNGSNVKLLSYDVEPLLKRINPNLITDACAEYFESIYKLSFALDSSLTNNATLHVDAINYNSETENPNIYGPHTYGFRSSANLNFKRFKAQMIFGKDKDDGSWVFKVDDVMTQYAASPASPGDLIPAVLISPMYGVEKEGEYDETWVKRYEKIYSMFPPSGNWFSLIELLCDFKNQVTESFNQFMDGSNYKLESFFLGQDPFDISDLSVQTKLNDVKGNSLQLRISNYSLNTKFWWDSLTYDFRPIRRLKEVQRVQI